MLAYLIPGLAHWLGGWRTAGWQYLLTALGLWLWLGPSLVHGPWWWSLLAGLALLGVHLGSGLSFRAERGLAAGGQDHTAQVYRRWSSLIAGAVALLLLAAVLHWIINLPGWDVVRRNLLFFLIGRLRSAQYSSELWRLWGFLPLGLGALLGWALWRLKRPGAVWPLLLGLLTGGGWLWALIVPEVKLGGLGLSLLLALLGILLALPLGLLFGIGRTSRWPLIRWLSGLYVEVLRGVPFITVIFWFYIFVPYVLGEKTQFWAVILALGLFTGAYVAEIVRAGLLSLPAGQRDAAQALGLSGGQTMRLILLPQALRRMVPPLVGQLISLFKDTSLVSIIGFTELAGAARITGNREVATTFEIYLTVALLYFVFAWLLSRVAGQLEERVRSVH